MPYHYPIQGIEEVPLTYASTAPRLNVGELSESGYIRAICFFTMVMAGIVGAGSVLTYAVAFSWLLLGGCFAGALIGILMFTMSDNPLVSFIGVSILSLALGLMMGPTIAHYAAPVVMKAVIITALVMIVMSLLGIMVPAAFRGIGPYLMAGLTLLIVAQFAQIIFAGFGFHEATHLPLVTWAGIALFLGYTAYDWTRALELQYTWDNAIDTSGNLILDAVNLFLRILEVTSSSSSDD